MATLLAFIVYLITLAPSITWCNDGADGGDLITATVTGGVPHPSGYPTYLLLGSLFVHLPLGDLA
ncbi:MAG: protein O-mannosyl-transferase family, partial [Anaerolineae bacterium]